MDLLARLLDYETTEDAPPPDTGPPPEPTPEPAPEPEPVEAWQGPSQEEWEQTQRQLAQASELMNMLQTPTYPEPDPQQSQLPEYDPYDPEAAQAYFDAREDRMLGQIQNMLSPLTETYQNENAVRWAEDTLGRLGVPEDEHWRDGVLFASAGFQQFDPQGRPLVHPQQAAAQGYEFLKKFAEAERQAERARIEGTTAEQDEALRARAGAPDLPSGPAGGEGTPEGIDELQAARMWREREAAGQ